MCQVRRCKNNIIRPKIKYHPYQPSVCTLYIYCIVVFSCIGHSEHTMWLSTTKCTLTCSWTCFLILLSSWLLAKSKFSLILSWMFLMTSTSLSRLNSTSSFTRSIPCRDSLKKPNKFDKIFKRWAPHKCTVFLKSKLLHFIYLCFWQSWAVLKGLWVSFIACSNCLIFSSRHALSFLLLFNSLWIIM